MVSVLFWDIDGTLLTTGRAGIFAWEDATLEVLGRQLDFSALNTAGLTDVEIATDIIARIGKSRDTLAVQRLVGLYEQLLPSALPRKQGCVLPGVREILDAVSLRDDVVSALLTGNTKLGAVAKLQYYGLETYFDFGAFSGEHKKRSAIATQALMLAHENVSGFESERAFVIGDTPHDIRCGQAISVRTIAVATGQYSVSKLAVHKPWRTLENLPGADSFLELIS